MDKYVIVVEFCFTPSGFVFYMAHVFKMNQGGCLNYRTAQVSVTAHSPESALKKASDLLWLLN